MTAVIECNSLNEARVAFGNEADPIYCTILYFSLGAATAL